MKFREINLESGTRLLLGKNADNNDELMNKFVGKKNIIMHTAAPGSPFCVIENLGKRKDKKKAAVICAKFSQDWRDHKQDVLINVFTGKNISKARRMKTGTWKVGKCKVIRVKKEDIKKFKE
jgi:predicted ribosome quality control (RQC) complex YloA/Tae2 family protein